MKTQMAGTSLDTYHAMSVRDYLTPKEREVMGLMDLGYRMTREQIAEALHWKESSVCGRVNSLVAGGHLIEFEGAKTSTGRPAKFVQIAPTEAQREMFS